MNPVAKFVLRAVMGVVAGYFLARIFLKSESLVVFMALSALIIFLAYTMEYMRKRN